MPMLSVYAQGDSQTLASSSVAADPPLHNSNHYRNPPTSDYSSSSPAHSSEHSPLSLTSVCRVDSVPTTGPWCDSNPTGNHLTTQADPSSDDCSPAASNDDVDFTIRQVAAKGPPLSVRLPPADQLNGTPKGKEEDDDDQSTNCPFCEVLLLERSYLQRHLEEAHGLKAEDDQIRFGRDKTAALDLQLKTFNNLKTDVSDAMMEFCSSVIDQYAKRSVNGGEGTAVSELNDGLAGDAVSNRPVSPSFCCNPCGLRFNSELDSWAHKRVAHSNGNPPAGKSATTSSHVRGAMSPATIEEVGVGAGSGAKTSAPGGKIFNPEAYCELCDKEFCNKYFLKTHKANKHGVYGSFNPAFMGGMDEATLGGAGGHMSHDPTRNKFFAADVQQEAAAGLLLNLSACQKTTGTSIDDGGSSPTQRSGLSPKTDLQVSPTGGPFGLGFDLQRNAAESACPYCGQIFSNSLILQGHIFAVHGPAVSAASTANFQAAALQAALMTSQLNPFLVQQLNFLQNPGYLAMLGGVPGVNAPSSSSLLEGPLPPTSSANDAEMSAGDGDVSFDRKLNVDESIDGILSAVSKKSKMTPLTPAAGRTMNTSAGGSESFCELCRKGFCNKYFLKTHKLNKHGILPPSNFSSPESMWFGDGNADPSPNRKRRCDEWRLTSKALDQTKNKQRRVLELGEVDRSETIDDALADRMAPKRQEAGNEATVDLAPIECTHCTQKFSTNVALLAHKYRDHGIFDSRDGWSDDDRSTKISVSADLQTSTKDEENIGRRSSCGDTTRPDNNQSYNEFSDTSKHGIDADAYCNICNKEFCSKYFLRTHKLNIHGVVSESSPSQLLANSNVPANPENFDKNLSASVLAPKRPSSIGRSCDFVTSPNLSLTPPTSSSQNISTFAALFAPTSGGKKNPHHPSATSSGKNFCDICNKELCNKYFLRTHMLKMHGVVIDENKIVIGTINSFDDTSPYILAIFRCEVCGKEMASKQQLKIHLQIVHPGFLVPNAAGCRGIRAGGCPAPEVDETPTNQNHADGELRVKQESVDVAVSSRNCDAEMAVGPPMSTLASPMASTTPASFFCCEYCALRFEDQTAVQMHIIDAHQREVRGRLASLAEQAALDALGGSGDVDVDSEVGVDDENESTDGNGVGQRLIDETIERIAAVQTDVPQTVPVRDCISTQSPNGRILPMVARNDLGTKMYKCSYCNYYTRWISNLSTHEKRHNVNGGQPLNRNDRPFVCRVCLRAYRYAHSLQRHMEVHRLSSFGIHMQMMTAANLAASSAINLHNPLLPCSTTNIQHQQGTTHVLEEPSESATDPPLTNGNDVDPCDKFLSTPPPRAVSDQSTKGHVSTVSKWHQPQQFVCGFCQKLFRNRELYRMHLWTIHKTTVPKSPAKNVQPNAATNGTCVATGHGSGSPKKIYRCKICGLAAKVYNELRRHLMDIHGITPRSSNGQQKVTSKSSDKITRLLTKNSPPTNTDFQNLPLNLKTAVGDRNEINSQNGVNFSPSDTSATKTDFLDTLNRQPFVMQPFFVKETDDSGLFVPSVVYLPLARQMNTPMETKFSLFPIPDENGDTSATTDAASTF